MKLLKGSKTEANLIAAYAGESQARNNFTFFAAKASQDGYEQIARIFTETANNEKEHAEIWFKLLQSGMPDTCDNLKSAAEGEQYEHESMYPQFAKEAKEEGFDKIAALFELVGKIEKEHMERYRTLGQRIPPATRICMNCGHTYVGPEPPKTCPVCGKPQGWSEIKAENY